MLYSKNLTPWPLTLKINRFPDSPKDYVCTKFGQNPLKDVDPRVFTRMLRKGGRTEGRTYGSVTVSLRNFVGEGIIKTNFKQIARVELKCVQYSEGDYILCMTSRYFFRSFTNARLLCFVSHSNGMTSCQSSSTDNVSCNVAIFFYHHDTSCIRQATFVNFKGKRI
jgi:hypothetical protein